MNWFLVGGIAFAAIGLLMLLFRGTWSRLATRYDNYAKVPEAKRRSRPANFRYGGIVLIVWGAIWIAIALWRG